MVALRQFRKAKPSFADLTPVRARRPRRPSWLAYDTTGQEWPRS